MCLDAKRRKYASKLGALNRLFAGSRPRRITRSVIYVPFLVPRSVREALLRILLQKFRSELASESTFFINSVWDFFESTGPGARSQQLLDGRLVLKIIRNKTIWKKENLWEQICENLWEHCWTDILRKPVWDPACFAETVSFPALVSRGSRPALRILTGDTFSSDGSCTGKTCLPVQGPHRMLAVIPSKSSMILRKTSSWIEGLQALALAWPPRIGPECLSSVLVHGFLFTIFVFCLIP